MGSSYFDISVSPSSPFTEVSFDVCEIPSGKAVQWRNPHVQAYQLVPDQTVVSGAHNCATVVIGADPRSTVSDLRGTVFARAALSVSHSGYWEVASDGWVFAFGDAGFYGSLGATTLDKPIVGIE
jgi:hypothetical protein